MKEKVQRKWRMPHCNLTVCRDNIRTCHGAQYFPNLNVHWDPWGFYEDADPPLMAGLGPEGLSYKAPEASHLWITRQVAESKRFQCKWLSVENTSILCPLLVSVGLEHKSMRKNFLWHQSQNTRCPVHINLICSFNHFFPTCWYVYMVGLGCYNSSPPPLVVVIL